MRSVIRKRSLTIGVAGAALVAVIGGIAYAAIPSTPGGVINGCYARASGALRVIDPAAGQTCASRETALTWQQAGAQGIQGIQGDVGPRGPSNAYTTGLDLFTHALPDTGLPTIAKLDLPPGSYVFNASVLVGNTSTTPDTAINCSLRWGEGSAVMVGVAEARLAGGAPGAQGSTANLPLTGTATFTEPQTVRLICVTTATPSFAQYDILNAVQVASLETQPVL